jgi:hypothetical protein
MLDIQNALANLAAFGLGVDYWVPCRGSGNDRHEIGGGKARPILKANDVRKFMDEFPTGLALLGASVNGGQSVRVKLQGVIRREVEKDRNIDDQVLLGQQLKSLLGVRESVGTVSAMTDDALLAELARRRGITIEEAAELLS